VLTHNELAAVYRTALEASDPFSDIVALLILPGQRRGEIGGLCRPWIDTAERIFILPAEITKNGLEHTFPYGDSAPKTAIR
jgi:integrase